MICIIAYSFNKGLQEVSKQGLRRGRSASIKPSKKMFGQAYKKMDFSGDICLTEEDALNLLHFFCEGKSEERDSALALLLLPFLGAQIEWLETNFNEILFIKGTQSTWKGMEENKIRELFDIVGIKIATHISQSVESTDLQGKLDTLLNHKEGIRRLISLIVEVCTRHANTFSEVFMASGVLVYAYNLDPKPNLALPKVIDEMTELAWHRAFRMDAGYTLKPLFENQQVNKNWNEVIEGGLLSESNFLLELGPVTIHDKKFEIKHRKLPVSSVVFTPSPQKTKTNIAILNYMEKQKRESMDDRDKESMEESSAEQKSEKEESSDESSAPEEQKSENEESSDESSAPEGGEDADADAEKGSVQDQQETAVEEKEEGSDSEASFPSDDGCHPDDDQLKTVVDEEKHTEAVVPTEYDANDALGENTSLNEYGDGEEQNSALDDDVSDLSNITNDSSPTSVGGSDSNESVSSFESNDNFSYDKKQMVKETKGLSSTPTGMHNPWPTSFISFINIEDAKYNENEKPTNIKYQEGDTILRTKTYQIILEAWIKNSELTGVIHAANLYLKSKMIKHNLGVAKGLIKEWLEIIDAFYRYEKQKITNAKERMSMSNLTQTTYFGLVCVIIRVMIGNNEDVFEKLNKFWDNRFKENTVDLLVYRAIGNALLPEIEAFQQGAKQKPECFFHEPIRSRGIKNIVNFVQHHLNQVPDFNDFVDNHIRWITEGK